MGTFEGRLFRYPGKGGWTFVEVPEDHAPKSTQGWGRAPVNASVDGREWKTSTWREKSGRTLLPVPKPIRAGKGHGDSVVVTVIPVDDDDDPWKGVIEASRPAEDQE